MDIDKKYEFTGESKPFIERNTRVYRIKAIKDFGIVKAGDLGGWIEKEENLSHEGNCWIYDEAVVCDNACVFGNATVSRFAYVCNNAKVFDDARITDMARIKGNACVFQNAIIAKNACVMSSALVFGEAKILDNVMITGKTMVFDNATVVGNYALHGGGRVHNHTMLRGQLDHLKFEDGADAKPIEIRPECIIVPTNK